MSPQWQSGPGSSLEAELAATQSARLPVPTEEQAVGSQALLGRGPGPWHAPPTRWSLGLPGGTCVKCWWGGPRPPSLRGKERERDSAGDGPGTTNAPARGSWQIQVSGGLQLDSLRSPWRSFLLHQGLGPALVSKSEPGPRRPEGRAVTHGPTARPAGGVGRRAGQGGPRGRLGRRSSLPAGTLAENGLCGRREGSVPCSPPSPTFR